MLSSTPLSMPTDLWVPITKDISPMYANQFSIGGYYSGLPGWGPAGISPVTVRDRISDKQDTRAACME